MAGGIALIIDDSDRHGYFALSLIKQGLPVRGVITGAKRRIVKTMVTAPDWSEAERAAIRSVKQQRKVAEYEAFAGSFERFAEMQLSFRDHVREQDGDVNHPRFAKLLADHGIQLVAVMGATMLKDPLLSLGLPFVNMHTGLSPYYRGGRSNMWPVIEGDYGYFGVTVHRIAPGIDDGDIWASRRLLVNSSDDYAKINCRAIQEGSGLTGQTLDALLRSPAMAGVKQWSKGKLFYDKHYTAETAMQYLRDWPAFKAEHIRRQGRGELDPVRTIDPPL